MKWSFRRQNTIYLTFLILVVFIALMQISFDDFLQISAGEQKGLCLFKRFVLWFTRLSYVPTLPGLAVPAAKDDGQIVIIYWTKVFTASVSVGNSKKWPFFYVGKECPVQCTLTADHSKINEAAAIVVHARNIEEMPPQDKHPHARWILHSNESPRFTPAMQSAQIMSKFNFYLSYRLDADFPLTLFSKPTLKPLPVPFHKKHRVAAVALYSHCEAIRTAYLVKLMRHFPVHSYGGCLHNVDLPENVSPRGSSNFAETSMELYKSYKFTIVFMNSDCDYFVDEKLYHALSAGSVPVFIGTDKIREFLPGYLREAVIEVRDFATPKLLATYLNRLAKDEVAYSRYLRWKYEGYDFPRNYSRSVIGKVWDGLPPFCKICMALHSGKKGKNGLAVETCARRNLSYWIKQ